MEYQVNRDLLAKVRAAIGADPEHWDQSKWVVDLPEFEGQACGTAFCFAGWTSVLTGRVITPGNDFVPLTHIRKVTGLDNDTILSRVRFRVPRTAIVEPEIHVSDAAEIMLGLHNVRIIDPRPMVRAAVEAGTFPEPKANYAADLLFAGGNDLADLDAVINAILEV